MGLTFRFNEKSWSTKINKILEEIEDEVRDDLKDVAEVLVMRSPVKTGAYVESHSVSYSTGGFTRSRSSRGRPLVDGETARIGAYNQLSDDIDRLDFKNNKSTSVKFTNRAPHAGTVETKYQVYGVALDRKK